MSFTTEPFMPRLHYAAFMFVAARLLSAQSVDVRVDSARAEAAITVGPLGVPAATPYNHHFSQAPIEFAWPVSGWVRGFRVELVDSTGRTLPREMLHHAGITNLDRRQLAYPTAERLVAVGRETAPVSLPGSFGAPLVAGQRMLLYYALANPSDRPVTGATLRITMPWAPADSRGVRTVMPIYFDAYPTLGGASTFDAAPGRSETSAEFTLPTGGHLRYLGGHLHDYGVELRLEDAESNRVLARLAAERNGDGTIRGVARTRFLLKWNGLRLEADHRYRVVAAYDNPTCEVAGGAMGLLVAVFVPDDMRRWPVVDSADASYRKDLAWLRETNGGDAGEAHRHESDASASDSAASVAPSCSGPGRRSSDVATRP
jgi:hypothetical protein